MRHANPLARLLGLVLLAGLSSYPAAAQEVGPSARAAGLTASDSALVARILLAEDRRDSLDGAWDAGAAHADPRVRALALRARERTRDAQFLRRDSLGLPALPAPPAWPEPEWKGRYRAVAASRDDCAAIRAALRDSVTAVRLRAAALVRASCAADDVIVGDLIHWIDQVPNDPARHRRGQPSWHLAAHGVVALARLRPDSAAWRVRVLAGHRQWELRQYAARAAAALKDASTLQRLAGDRNDNVVEAAIDGLAALKRPRDRVVIRAALRRNGAQAVRAAALALAGSDDPRTRAAAEQSLERFTRRANASERDVRVALLAVLGRPASDDIAPPRPDLLERDAVALALGATRYVEVTLDPAHGGGTFTVHLRGDVAPLMAARILALVRQGYYDGSSWHRVEHDFVVQGGSPGANEYVGEARALRDELGTLPHARGSIGMSTRGHDTGDAQWFVNLRDNLRLGRDYTVFAEVVAGMDIVDAILEGDRILHMREVVR